MAPDALATLVAARSLVLGAGRLDLTPVWLLLAASAVLLAATVGAERPRESRG